MPEDIDLGNGLMLRQLPEGSYTYPKSIPTEETDTDPFAIAAARVRQSVKGRQQLPVDEPTPYKAPNYVMAPDLLEAQQGAHLPTGIAYNDAGIPFNKATGVELPTVPRPNVLPIARTPDGLTLAMPKAMDIFGNMMGGVAGAPVKGAEVLLGSGPVRKTYQEILEAQRATEGMRAAMRDPLTGKIYTGLSHQQAIEKAPSWKEGADEATNGVWGRLSEEWDKGTNNTGFIDKNGNFVSRSDAEKNFGVTTMEDLKDLRANKSKTVMFRSDTRNQVYSEVGRQLEKGPFFSALEKAVDTAKVGKADAQQWLGYLKNQPGVKSEELSYVLKDLPEGPISKEQLGEIIKGNKVELKEKVKSSVDENSAEFKNLTQKIMDEEKPKGGLSAAQDKAYEILSGAGEPKYSKWQLPGGENYKEMLLTLPGDKNKERLLSVQKEMQDIENSASKNPTLFKDKDLAEKYVNLSKERDDLVDKSGQFTDFKSSHWDEPNIIAHVRHNDRMIDGKKTLHLEEIQSDWHQKGRNEGYKLSDKQRKDLDIIEGKLTSKLTEAEIGNPDIDNVLKVAVEKKVISSEEARNYKDYVKGENSTVPDAPFKKNWDELALKRMLHKAADEGYEGISWTPGEAQAARYDLSKQVSGIHWQPSPADKNASLVQINPVNGDALKLQIDKIGKVVAGFPQSRTNQWEGKNLSDVVGKEHAEKILAKTNGSLEGEGLKIGGEGMKSFYDKMLVDKANALGKKYGAKVEHKFINTDPNEKLGKGSVTERAIGGYRVEYPNGLAEVFRDKADAERSLANWKSDKNQPIHYLPITKELREKAKSGFPLFSQVPSLTPVQHNPFASEEKKSYTLVPVNGNPFQ